MNDNDNDDDSDDGVEICEISLLLLVSFMTVIVNRAGQPWKDRSK